MTVLQNEVKTSDLLIFVIDGNRYGIPASEIVEVTRAVAISPLPYPNNHHGLEGIVNLHGTLAAAINLRSRFGLANKDLSPSEHFIFTRASSHLVALRADRVLEIIQAPVEVADLINSPPKNSDQGRSIAGLCKLSDGLIFIFDLQNFLSQSESRSVAEQLTRAAQKEAGAGQHES